MKNFLRKLFWEAPAIVKASDLKDPCSSRSVGGRVEKKSLDLRDFTCGTNIINQTSDVGVWK